MRDDGVERRKTGVREERMSNVNGGDYFTMRSHSINFKTSDSYRIRMFQRKLR